MLVVIEGPDNSGKSTLVNSILGRVPGARFISMLGGRTEPADVLKKRVADTLEGSKKYPPATLTERYHPISDKVYRGVFGGRRAFTESEYKDAIHALTDYGSIIVYCRPSIDTALKAIHENSGDDEPEWVEKVLKDLPRLFVAYDAEMHRIAWNMHGLVIPYDYERAVSSMIEDSICAALR